MSTTATQLKKLATLVRYFIIRSTTAAGSGHPSSSLSAADLMTVLLFGGFFKADLNDPSFPNNDRLIFSKGHAAPLLFSLYAAAGKVSDAELLSLRKFGSPLEGHPTMAFPYTEAATGSLGQGLSVGVGMALQAKKIAKLPFRTFVLLGDSELAEGSNWEAMELAAYYGLDNLVAIVDVNRLGQRGETMAGHHVEVYKKRFAAFGFETFVVDGHNVGAIMAAYKKALLVKNKPVAIIAKTVKGKGVSFVENKDGWHGKVLSKEEAEMALREIGPVQKIVGKVGKPLGYLSPALTNRAVSPMTYTAGQLVATRKAYGNALARLYPAFPRMVVLDAETSNSTYADVFKKVYPERFFEMFIAEQNMVGVALGLSRRGELPFVSTFAAFLTRAADQIRMSQYSQANIKFVGSHAGVSIGEDGASQMALEDIALFRAMGCVVLYPSEAVSCERLVETAARHQGNVYIRTTRKETPVLYGPEETFPIGGSKVVRRSKKDQVTLVAAGVTLLEALKAEEVLRGNGVAARVIDLYSVWPVDVATLEKAMLETQALVVVEDHHAEGGLYGAVAEALGGVKGVPIYSLAATKMPVSGKPDELLAYEEIDAAAIVKKVKEIM